MLHARIAARAFNTPLLVEPSKAMAFLSGLGPRILGRRVEMVDGSETADGTIALPARASILAGGLTESLRHHGDAPYPVVDGIAVIEAAAADPAIRGLALEIDSFGGEVAGVFDLADRIRAIRGSKPVWAFVAEHAFSAGYALASQADRILLPRTGALGSIGVVVLHADMSGQLDQDGVRVTLVHSGQHKVDGNPYQPLPEAVRDDIQREIDVLRFLFAETVAAGRAGRLSHEAALATEAATFRGVDAVAAGLADEVTDLARGFAAFRQMLARTPILSPTRSQRVAATQSRNPTQPRQDAIMATENDPADSPQDTEIGVTDIDDGESDAADDLPATPVPAPTAPDAPAAMAPAPAQITTQTAVQTSNLAELSAQLREAAAEITEIAAQAGRLGITIDAAKALRDGTAPEALRKLVLERASAAADARDIVAAPPSLVLPLAKESPIVAAAKRAAASPRG